MPRSNLRVIHLKAVNVIIISAAYACHLPPAEGVYADIQATLRLTSVTLPQNAKPYYLTSFTTPQVARNAFFNNIPDSGQITENVGCDASLKMGRSVTGRLKTNEVSMVNFYASFHGSPTFLLAGKKRTTLSRVSEKWSTQIAVTRVEQLARDKSFEPAVKTSLVVTDKIDQNYQKPV
jgi:hypothetical protein